MNILLNGVGRIGKAIIRIALDTKAFNIIAINEINSNIQNIAYSINYDSTYGRYHDLFIVDKNYIQNSTTKIQIINEQNISNIDLEKLNIDFIIDASGISHQYNKLINLNTKAIFLTHPSKMADTNIILGVNEQTLDIKQHKIISTSSCNATALLPVLKLIDDKYQIESGDISTIHPMLNHQKVLDASCIDSKNREVTCNFEFGRGATQNIIPSKTTTIEACSYILPYINSDIFSSSSLRIPTQTVGVINVTLFIKNSCTKEQLLKLFEIYEQTQTFDILLNNYAPLVSSDFQAQRFTSIIDHRFTDIKNNQMIKLVIWYDNEWGYASKVVDIVKFTILKFKK